MRYVLYKHSKTFTKATSVWNLTLRVQMLKYGFFQVGIWTDAWTKSLFGMSCTNIVKRLPKLHQFGTKLYKCRTLTLHVHKFKYGLFQLRIWTDAWTQPLYGMSCINIVKGLQILHYF